jgi:hypothetical protein
VGRFDESPFRCKSFRTMKLQDLHMWLCEKYQPKFTDYVGK